MSKDDYNFVDEIILNNNAVRMIFLTFCCNFTEITELYIKILGMWHFIVFYVAVKLFTVFPLVCACQVMKASFWCFLEVILVGSLMLYSTVSLHDSLSTKHS